MLKTLLVQMVSQEARLSMMYIRIFVLPDVRVTPGKAFGEAIHTPGILLSARPQCTLV